MVVAQSMALLAWDAAYLALLSTEAIGAPLLVSGAAGSAAQQLGRDEGGAFVELLTVGCLLAAPPLVLLLRRASRPSQPNWPMLGAPSTGDSGQCIPLLAPRLCDFGRYTLPRRFPSHGPRRRTRDMPSRTLYRGLMDALHAGICRVADIEYLLD